MTSFKVNVDVTCDGEYYSVDSYVDDLVEGNEGLEDMIAVSLAKTVLNKINDIKKSISDGNISDLITEYKTLIESASANSESDKTE